MRWEKKGRIFRPENVSEWWKSHAMAPSAVQISKNTIRVYLGCWDSYGISRIGYLDLDSGDPSVIQHISKEPVLDVGRDGTFDENGVFPGHATIIEGKVFLYYTGFQLGLKVRYHNFGGLALSDDGIEFQRVSEVPVLDRSDEGLSVRAGQSVLFEDGLFKSWYSAGSEWVDVGGKLRPTYNVFHSTSKDGLNFGRSGQLCVSCDQRVEHGLGRPQIVRIADGYLLFYTRRIVEDMKYWMGVSRSEDGINWERIDEEIGISHSRSGWDSEMLYFPSLIQTDEKTYLFYSGNEFGREGFGYAELISW